MLRMKVLSSAVIIKQKLSYNTTLITSKRLIKIFQTNYCA
jgi:hypothetical protein